MNLTNEQIEQMVKDANFVGPYHSYAPVLYNELCCHIRALAGQCDKYATLIEDIRKAIEEIVVPDGLDAGVILLSSESPTHYDPNVKCQVYDHENFSPLGDALVKLWKLTNQGATE